MGKGAPVPVTIDGVTYRSYRAASIALGFKPETIRQAALRGTLHRVGCGQGGPEAMPIRVRDVVYPDVNAAAAALGVTPSGVYRAIWAGKPDRIGRPAVLPPSPLAKPVRLGGVTWPSRSAAARDLGCAITTVSNALAGKGSRMRERLVARAMQLAAAREAAVRAGRMKGFIVPDQREAA